MSKHESMGLTLEVGGAVTLVFWTGVNVAEKHVHDLVEPRDRFRLSGLSPSPRLGVMV